MKKIYKYWPLVVVSLFSLTPIVWFLGKGNVLISGVDTNFPLDPIIWFQRRFFVWNAISNAGSDFSSSTAGLFFHLIQYIPCQMGFGLQSVQIISLIFWFSLIVLGSFLLAKIIFPKSPPVQLLFMSLYTFNIYLFNTWENVKVANISLVASVPFALATLIMLRQKSITVTLAIVYSVLTGIILSGAGINPAYFVTFFLIILIFVLSEITCCPNSHFIFSRTKHFLIISIPIILVNLFWLLPTVYFISSNISPAGSIGEIGFTNWVDSLSENTSILNVLRMQGAWDWYPIDVMTNTPYYIPYATSYFNKIPFILFSFLLPFLAFTSFLKPLKTQLYLYVGFGAMLIIGVFLGAGTHSPTGSMFRLLLDHIPFFSLFRSPWYIFTPLVIIAISGLVSLLLYEYWGKTVRSRLIIIFLTGILIIGNLFYSYPLISGRIFRPDRTDSFYIHFPDYIFQARDWLAKNNYGRIVSYPDIEVENFSWGYRGIETILELLVDRETLFTPLNTPDSAIASLLKEFYHNVKKGELEAAESLGGKLNVGLIFEKKDQQAVYSPLQPVLKDYQSYKIGEWEFYKLPNLALTPKLYSAREVFFTFPYDKTQPFFSAVNATDLVLNPQDNTVKMIPNIDGISGSIILAENKQTEDFADFKQSVSRLNNRLSLKDLSEAVFSVEFTEDSMRQPVIERYKLEDFGLMLGSAIELEVNGRKEKWEIDKVNDSFVFFKPVFLPSGKYTIKLKLVNRNLIDGGNFNEGISFDNGGEWTGSGIYELLNLGNEKYLSITNLDKVDIAAVFKLSSFDPMSDYYIETKYKQIYGNNAQVVITQWNFDRLLKVGKESMPNYPDWKTFSFYFDPVKVVSDLRIELTAPHVKDPLGTTVYFDEVKVYKVFSNKLLFINKSNSDALSVPKINFKQVSPAFYEAEVSGAYAPHVIVFSENYSPLWQLTVFNNKGEKISNMPRHFSANLYANAWYLENTPLDYSIKISYQPQRFFLIGSKITGATIVISIILIIKLFLRKGKRTS